MLRLRLTSVSVFQYYKAINSRPINNACGNGKMIYVR